jgi:hypothetical protein
MFLERKDGTAEPLQYMINLPFRRHLTDTFKRAIERDRSALSSGQDGAARTALRS